MARKKDEIYEDEDYEEEEEEEDEEEEDLGDELEAEIKRMIQLRKQEKDPTERAAIAEEIATLMEAYRSSKAAKADEAEAENVKIHKYDVVWQVLGTGACNALTQLAISTMNRKNVKTVVDCENNGGIIRSAATKFVK